MNISRLSLFLVACMGVVNAPFQALAADESSDRGVSIFDKQPQCTERRELKPGQTDPCEIQNGPPRRRVFGAGNAPAPSVGAGNGAQGASSSSGNTSQGGAQVRR